MSTPLGRRRLPGDAGAERSRRTLFPRRLALALLRPHVARMPFSRLPPLLAEALSARGYAAPTPVQAAVLEADAEGRDLIVSAQTGSGKTVAFGLAMAPQLLEP